MKFVLFHLLPVISFVIPLSSFATDVEESIDPETYCITHAKRLILENDQTVRNNIQQLSESFFRKQSDSMVLHRIYETSRNRFQTRLY